MRFLRLLLVSTAVFLLLSIVTATQAGALRLKNAEIIDRSGFERPMTAMTLLIPSDWHALGAVNWYPTAACQAEATRVEWFAADPSGFNAVEFIPGAAWTWNNSSLGQLQGGNCSFQRISTAREFLEFLVAQRRPGAVILDYRQRPDLTKDVQA